MRRKRGRHSERVRESGSGIEFYFNSDICMPRGHPTRWEVGPESRFPSRTTLFRLSSAWALAHWDSLFEMAGTTWPLRFEFSFVQVVGVAGRWVDDVRIIVRPRKAHLMHRKREVVLIILHSFNCSPLEDESARTRG